MNHRVDKMIIQPRKTGEWGRYDIISLHLLFTTILKHSFKFPKRIVYTDIYM